MKIDVYRWRVSSQRKAELEIAARREGTSLAGLLEQITGDWLQARSNSRNGDAAEQAEIRRLAAPAIGSVRGGDPTRSSRSSQLIRETLPRRNSR
ncbi:MAG: hypothetical protein WCC32_10130 [Terriglobales bacterium]